MKDNNNQNSHNPEKQANAIRFYFVRQNDLSFEVEGMLQSVKKANYKNEKQPD